MLDLEFDHTIESNTGGMSNDNTLNTATAS